jgi:hypothetical protein
MHPREFCQPRDDGERQIFQIVGIEKGEMESGRIQCTYDSIDRRLCSFIVEASRSAHPLDALL